MKFFIFLQMTALLFMMSYCNKPGAIQLKSGDLLFTGPDIIADSGKLSHAIDEVTRTGLKTNYSHVGIVEVDDYGIWVIHAEPQRGVNRESLDSFLRTDDQGAVFAYRLKHEYHEIITEALQRAHHYIGQPYDFTYLLGDSSQYCSGLIYKLFEPFNIFELNPMTFIDPETGAFHPYWLDYFDELGIEIPEGYLGCNPNGMAASEVLEFLGKIKK